MDGEKLTLLAVTGILVLLMAGLSWALGAAATGRIKRNAWIGIRTPALMHCDECWLLGHHAASHKGILGCRVAGLVMAAGAAAALLAPQTGFPLPVCVVLGVLVMLSGVMLGLRDANTMLAKMHPGEPAVRG